MDNTQVNIATENNIPIISLTGNCKAEGLEGLVDVIQEMATSGQNKFVFDFSACKLINSPAMGELLEAILTIDNEFDGHIAISGLDSLKETLFTVAGIIPLVQSLPDKNEAVAFLQNIKD